MPVANFTNNLVCSGFATQFSNTSTVSGSIVSNTWNFHNIGSSNQLHPSFTFFGSGSYDVGLIITDNNGCIDSITRVIQVSGSPVAQFTVDTVCLGTSTKFTENSTQSGSTPIRHWHWNFGDGITGSFTGNFTHTYTTVGNYTVSLQVEDSVGCLGVSNKLAIVRAIPVANAGSDVSICFGDSTDLEYIGVSVDSVKWSNGATTPLQTVSPTLTTTNRLTV